MKTRPEKYILVIDDHDIFRRGVQALLGEHCLDCRVFEADSVETAMRLPLPAPRLILVDIRLPGMSGLAGIAPLRQRWPATVVVVLSSLEGDEVRAEALAHGAAAFISKGEASGQIFAQVLPLLADSAAVLPVHADAAEPVSHLTPRQREVLDLLCQGLPNKLVARHLALSENTVRRHVQDILEHFGAASRAEAVFAARRRGLVE